MSLIPKIAATNENLISESKNVANTQLITTPNNNALHSYTENNQLVSKSMSWYRLSADKSDAQAQNTLGRMYEIGRGVPVDYHSAFEWYLKAAKQNNTTAYSNIGSLFLQGKGVPVDTYKALEWFIKDDSKVVKIKTLMDQGVYISKRDKKKTLEQLVKETQDIIHTQLKVENNRLRYSAVSLQEHINHQNTTIAALQKDLGTIQSESQNTINTLQIENKSLLALSIQERQSVINEMQLLKMTNISMEQQLKDKDTLIQSLQKSSKQDSQEVNKMVTTLENLLQSKTNEIKLLKDNMNYVLQCENRKKRKLEKDNKRMKREIKKEQVEETKEEDMEVDIQDEAVDVNSVAPSNSEEDDTNKKRKAV